VAPGGHVRLQCRHDVVGREPARVGDAFRLAAETAVGGLSGSGLDACRRLAAAAAGDHERGYQGTKDDDVASHRGFLSESQEGTLQSDV
jgi:hypothetical protein